MTQGSYVNDQDEIMLAVLTKDGSNATKVAERFRSEVSRADNNAHKLELVTSRMQGMIDMARIFASKGKP
jgi:multidrug efflux pump subunit AcrB